MTCNWRVLCGMILLILAIGCSEQKDNSSPPTQGESKLAGRGQEVYVQVCAGCHGSGLAGAPKFGDSEAWAPRISKGMDALVNSAVQGKGNMPARGGQAGLSDHDIREATEFMVTNSR